MRCKKWSYEKRLCNKTCFFFEFSFHRPERSCGKVMFLHLSVIFSGEVSGRHPLGTPPMQTPPRQTLLWVDTPLLGTHPGQTPLRQTPPGRHTPPGRLPSKMATAADGTHPTGMHSYFGFDLHCLNLKMVVNVK